MQLLLLFHVVEFTTDIVACFCAILIAVGVCHPCVCDTT